MKGIEVRKMRFKEKEIVLKDGTKCILRSPNEDDAKEIWIDTRIISTILL